MVAVRSMGLSLESLVGWFDETTSKAVCNVPNEQLEVLLKISNERFLENQQRIERFRTYLCNTSKSSGHRKKGQDGKEWEDAQARKQRKRLEGLRKAEEKKMTISTTEAARQSKADVIEIPASIFEQPPRLDENENTHAG